VSVVVPFRRPPKKGRLHEDQPSCCPKCGWKMPPEIRADRESLKKALDGDQMKVYLDCPECGIGLFWIVKFALVDAP